MQIGKYPESMYRVSLKVIIRNDANEILVVKEKGPGWSLPGGGIDHGEKIDVALKRELYEEILVDVPFAYTFVGVDTFYIEHRKRWQMWLICQLDIKGKFAYGKGADAEAVMFADPATFRDSNIQWEQLVYKWCTKKA